MQSENLTSNEFAAAGLSVVIIVIGLVLSITACGRGEIEPTPTPTHQVLNETTLAFETVEQKDWPLAIYSLKEPGIMVITSQENISNLQAVSEETTHRLQELDYESSFVLIVFQGQQVSGGYTVQIENITLSGTTINVYTQFRAPTSDEERVDLINSPYHLVKIQKSQEGEWEREFLFQVIVDDTIVATLNHFIP